MLKFFLAIFLTLAAVFPPAEASSTASADRSAARLFQASTSDGAWTAGIEIKLADGWKTYWRIPGDSGVPPQFDWSKSTNLKSVTIGWPAPRRYHDAAGETIGYTTRVVFPLHIEPVDSAKPVDAVVSLFYAVCKDICIPVETDLALEFSPSPQPSPSDKMLLDSFAARIPAASSSSMIPAIQALRLARLAEGHVLEVTLKDSLPSKITDIFVEGYPKAYFRRPAPAQPGPVASAFHLTVDGLDNAAELRGKQLTVTVVSGAASLVQSLTVE
ncbi:MAG TPA: protein-disulfide reductase DsbD domain-containing protein [Aestuariivirgaceae bacterium]|nr:protein-disulfide reductase DsbD domain-containing protein [Aestuariivirgaceae bacterium]